MFVFFNTVQAACISLQSSKHCPEYQNYSIESFQGVENAQQFDDYIDANAAFNFGNRCPAWSSARETVIRYAPSFTCSYAVYYSTTQRLCNNGSTPMLLCRASTALAYQDVLGQLQTVL
jgi:hypothetical protein